MARVNICSLYKELYVYAYRMYVVCITGTDLLKDTGKKKERVVTDTFKQRSGTS
jgi:hypothetical protein